jgi:hypothetical protein
MSRAWSAWHNIELAGISQHGEHNEVLATSDARSAEVNQSAYCDTVSSSALAGANSAAQLLQPADSERRKDALQDGGGA